jgi:hypothetical protein
MAGCSTSAVRRLKLTFAVSKRFRRLLLYGDDAERETPPAVKRLLIGYGGKTPTGLPMWRLVRAGSCRMLCQGRIHHFPRGVDMSIEDAASIRPDRIGGGVMLLPRYRDIDAQAWILQKWFPPSTWGTAIQWREHRAEDPDTPLFVQEFPHGGDYFMMAGPWRSIEEAGDLRAALRTYLRAMEARPKDGENYVRQMMAEEVNERAERLEKLEREIYRAEVEHMEVLKSVGADAQKIRNLLADQAGVKGHLGASEAWG